jgi:hypothetical protein
MTPGQAYTERLASAEAEADRAERRSGTLGLSRLAAFLLAVLCVIAAAYGFPLAGAGFSAGVARAVPAGLAALLVVAFAALVGLQARVLERRDRARFRAEVNRRGLRRLSGAWAEEPARALPASPLPPYAGDLDLCGAASLVQLCDATHTAAGERALLAALARAEGPGTGEVGRVREMQEAVRELAPLVDLRQALEVEGMMLAGRRSDGRKPNPEPLLRWAEGAALFGKAGPALRWLSGLPLLTVPLIGLALFDVGGGWVEGALVGLLMAQTVLTLSTAPRISEALHRIEAGETALSAYGEMLALLAGAPLVAPANEALRAQVRTGGVDPARTLRRLQSAYGSLELRKNPLLWLPLNVVLLWDLFFALRLRAWQAEVGPHLRGWLEALGELEARASLASLAHDNPGWTFPEVVEGPPCFSAEDLGHPLLRAEARVGNDLELPGPGRSLLLTGSNMSGKSTMLRSIGLSVVMAHAGGPVCARRLRMSPLRLRTVMRVDDSLARGVSHFYAELQRLKETLAAAREAQSQAEAGGPALCYLLDEILHGTNTREREIGAKLVIKTLCKRGAMGAVSTHDLGLAELAEETGGAVRNMHFTEEVSAAAQGEMRFDYKLREGPVTTTNALRLMRLCGMDIDW